MRKAALDLRRRRCRRREGGAARQAGPIPRRRGDEPLCRAAGSELGLSDRRGWLPYSYALGAEIKHPELDVIPERSGGGALNR